MRQWSCAICLIIIFDQESASFVCLTHRTASTDRNPSAWNVSITHEILAQCNNAKVFVWPNIFFFFFNKAWNTLLTQRFVSLLRCVQPYHRVCSRADKRVIWLTWPDLTALDTGIAKTISETYPRANPF